MKNKTLITVMITLCLQGCFQKYSYMEKHMPKQVELTQELQNLFSKTKLVCFGRYALNIPSEAKIIIGTTGFPSDIETFFGDFESLKERVNKDIKLIQTEENDSEITFNQAGPVERSWQIRYHRSQIGKKIGLHFFNTYINFGNINFLLLGSIGKEKTEERAAIKQEKRSKVLRLRGDEEIPRTPGYCIKNGFLSDDLYSEQETVDIGVYFPSFPDISFSVSSNKNAYSDYPPAQFEKIDRAELSLLNRIAEAKKAQGIHYPNRTLLREGKRAVQHWLGEESLIRRSDGVHDFEWHFVGTPKDVANPPEFNVRMYTKVAYNSVGAAKAASLTDDEAVALWDTLLSGLKFRVKVPGAPKGSYYFPDDEQTASTAGQ